VKTLRKCTKRINALEKAGEKKLAGSLDFAFLLLSGKKEERES
jgi:hypothetical protein